MQSIKINFQVSKPHDLVLLGEIAVVNSFRHKHHRDRLGEVNPPIAADAEPGIIKGPKHYAYSDSR